MLLDIMSHVFREGEQLQSGFEVFELKCRLYRAISNEEVPENLKVAIVHRNLQDLALEAQTEVLRNPGRLHTYQGRDHQLYPRGSCIAENCAHGPRSGEFVQRERKERQRQEMRREGHRRQEE